LRQIKLTIELPILAGSSCSQAGGVNLARIDTRERITARGVP
jgi:hypothetical protein